MTLTVSSYLIAEGAATAAHAMAAGRLGGHGGRGALKGLIGIVFPGAAIFLYCVVHRDFGRLARLVWMPGLCGVFRTHLAMVLSRFASQPGILRFLHSRTFERDSPPPRTGAPKPGGFSFQSCLPVFCL